MINKDLFKEKEENKKTTVVVGMSGGVDSSVTAYMLKQQGYNVIGLFMINWDEEDGECTAETDYEDVKRVCTKIGIPYYSVNYAKEYYENVFEYFLSQYKKGKTPNPDVLCNKEIKFGFFLKHALRLGADFVATGHYADKIVLNDFHVLCKAKDLNKDQSYFLHQLNQYQLSKAMFPLATLTKPEVREIAETIDLSNARKKDSTGICFIGERNFRKFLKNYLPMKSGKIETVDGEIVGEHDGLMYYTIGQRRGLNIGGKSGGTGERWFVLRKDLNRNVLVVSQGEGSALFSNECEVENINWIPEKINENICKILGINFKKLENGNLEIECYAKFRYRQPDQKVFVEIGNDNTAKVRFATPQRAVTAGQYAVFYTEKAHCIGGGEIL